MSTPRNTNGSALVRVMIGVAIVLLLTVAGIAMSRKWLSKSAAGKSERNLRDLRGAEVSNNSRVASPMVLPAAPNASQKSETAAIAEIKPFKLISPHIAHGEETPKSAAALDSRTNLHDREVSPRSEKSDLVRDEVSSRQEFRKDAELVYKRLPTMGSFQRLKEDDVHQAPQVVQQAGAQLGHLAEMLVNDPRRAHDGVRFYEQCFKRADLIPQIRALCLADFRKWKKRSPSDSARPEDLVGVPSQVIDLAGQIPVEK